MLNAPGASYLGCMRRFLTGTVAVLFFIQCPAQDDILRAALYLSGAQSEEEIDQDWIQRLEGVRDRPFFGEDCYAL